LNFLFVASFADIMIDLHMHTAIRYSGDIDPILN